MNTINKFLKSESGATAIEYGLIATMVSVAILAALQDFGNATEEMYDLIETAVVDATE